MPDTPLFIYNPTSTHAKNVHKDVFARLNDAGIRYGIYETKWNDFERNVDDIQAVVTSSDTIISAAGDGTNAQLVNAVLREGIGDKVRLGFLPYGNFNDLARVHMKRPFSILDLLAAEEALLYPLTVHVNGEHFRYVPAYITMGWTALAAAEFATARSRSNLRNTARPLKLGKSLLQLAKHYMNHRNTGLPPHMTSYGRRQSTDIMMVNNPRVGGIVKSTDYSRGHQFGFGEVDVSRVMPNIFFGLSALLATAPLERTSEVRVTFDGAVDSLPVHTEGEYVAIPDVEEVYVFKDSAQSLRVLSQHGGSSAEATP